MLIKRSILPQIETHLNQKEITFLAGPRQAGKTTLLKELQARLEKEGKKTVFFNLDIEQDKTYFSSQNQLLKKIKLEVGETSAYIFIDEIQRKENAGLFLKGLYDMGLPYKFIVSGSGSVELKEKVHESLAGRKRIFQIETLDFEEFVNYKTKGKYSKKLADFFSLEKQKTRGLLLEYLTFGGYPRVVIEEIKNEKIQILGEIYQSYLEKDAQPLLGIEKTEAFNGLVKLMASQIGQLTNINEIASTLKIAQTTVEKYLWYLEKTYILKKITPFYKNLRKEITKMPVFYFSDLGLRNYSLQTINENSIGENAGFIFQNFVLRLLLANTKLASEKINFWRTQDKSEVDFIWQKGGEIIPVEVKFCELKKPKIERPLRSFVQKYKPRQALIIHLGEKMTAVIENTKIVFLPFWEI